MTPSCSSSSSSIKEDVAFAAAATAVKGKRTKRTRSHPQPTFGESSSSVSSSGELSGAMITDEEEDMANCLILLAQGQALVDPRHAEAPPRFAYECKTCNKCFPTFQALGGHRASHKKPKTASTASIDRNDLPFVKPIITTSTVIRSGKQKVHECSICRLEFTSGQALGGHMRRHRPAAVVEPEHKEKSVLSLDLNLPAPDDDTGLFAVSPIIFAPPPALVDCHF